MRRIVFTASALVALTGRGVAAQSPCAGDGEPVLMQMLLEKTIFSVDVLWLSVRIEGPSADSLQTLSRRDRTDEREGRAAAVAAAARCATSRLDFVRDVSLDRFVGGIRESARAALDAGLVEPSTFRTIDENVTDWYAFLQDRGVKEGDRMTYRIRDDALNIRYETASGELLLDRTDVGEAEARSVLAGYFAPGSDFRGGLLDALFRASEP